ncbi:hypothetical protein ACTXT7_003344 [Hymenolepis weldensis]
MARADDVVQSSVITVLCIQRNPSVCLLGPSMYCAPTDSCFCPYYQLTKTAKLDSLPERTLSEPLHITFIPKTLSHLSCLCNRPIAH